MLSKFKRNIVDAFIDSVSNTLSSELSGTVTVNTTSDSVVGVGTNFAQDFTLTDRLYIGTQSRHITSITNSTVLTVDSPFSNNFVANTYQKGKLENNSYYVFAARHTPYDDESVPATVTDNDYDATIFIHDELMFARKLDANTVVPTIPKITWATNIAYQPYDDKKVDLANSNFYVLTTENKVYKCVEAPQSTNSTIEPSHTEVGYPPQESDGYRWLYLYEITNEQYLTFATENYIPVFENANVKNGSIDGAIYNFIVEANGSGYPADSGTITTNDANNFLIQIDDDSSSSNAFFSNCAITITNDTTNYTYVKEIRDYVSNTSGNFVILKEPFAEGQVANNQPYSIAPFIKIDSKFGSNCVAYCVMQNISAVDFVGSIQHIEIVNPGKNYLQANVTIQSSTGFGTGAIVRAVISPPGGHGFNVKDELFCTGVGVGIEFSNSAIYNFSSDIEFRSVGILKNPLAAQTYVGSGTIDIVSNSNIVQGTFSNFDTEINIGDHIVYGDEEKEVVSIANSSYLTIKTPFTRTVTGENYTYRPRMQNSFFNQAFYMAASNTTPALFNEGEFVVGSDGSGGGSQVMGKIAYANTSTVVLTGIDKDQLVGNTSANNFLNDILLTGVGYDVQGSDISVVASGAKYSKVASNSTNANGALSNTGLSWPTVFPGIKKFSGEVMYIQNVSPIKRSQSTNEQVRLIIKF